MAPARRDLPQGTLDLLILKTIALGPVHGYAIAQRLEQVSRGVVQVPETHPNHTLIVNPTGQLHVCW